MNLLNTCILQRKKKIQFTIKIFLTLFSSSLLFSCASTNDGFVSTSYHNLTAHYNAYFLASERFNEATKEVYEKREDNYNDILPVYPPLDTNILTEYNTVMDDCIKKCAIVIQKHPTSKWVDASYVLVGKARFYQADFRNAISTFKYVNGQATEEKDKHFALIELMRTFIEQAEINSARSVMNYLRREQLDENNILRFLVMRGHLYNTERNYKGVAKYLGEAVKLMPKGEQRARMFFILGQIYQKYERPNIAYKNYKQVGKNNPPYEMLFYSKLYMAQVSGKTGKDLQKTKKFFKKLLKDDKNKEFEDKIYYEMALFELEQGNVNEAVDFLKKSVFASIDNQVQKAYSFLKLADIHFDNLQRYELAKSYYDSAIINLPPEAENYEQLVERQKVLDEFVEYISTVRLEDSLQVFAKMDSVALNARLDYSLTLDEEKRQDELERQETARKKQAQRRNQSSSLDQSINSDNQWYFYNITSITLGRRNFDKTWKNRPLEDNWRRSLRSDYGTGIDSADIFIDNEISREDLIRSRVEKRKAELYQIIPFSPEAFQTSRDKLEKGLYNLGKTYQLKLREADNAAQTFARLLKEFPDSKYTSEVLYFMYVIYEENSDNAKAEKYKDELYSRFPNSNYVKLIENPDFLSESQENEREIKSAYKDAYKLFEEDRYSEAEASISQIISQYPNSFMNDKLHFLKLLISISTESPSVYKGKIEQFIKQFPESDLIPKAQHLLETAKTLQ